MDESSLPDYKDLPGNPDLARETTWGLFGDNYQLGTLNFLSSERIQDAARLVKDGKRFNLNLPMNVPFGGTNCRTPYPSPDDGEPIRKPYRVETHVVNQVSVEEVIHDFNPQASTQWDGLGHVRHPRYKYYEGADDDEVGPGETSRLSIGAWAEAGGIVGRGVLLDVARCASSTGVPYKLNEKFFISAEMLAATAAWEQVELRTGDILLVRTGWMKEHLGSAWPTVDEPVPGLGPGKEIAEFLWRNRVAAVAADNYGVEPTPQDQHGPRSLHIALLPMLGMPMGELFYLEDLAADCNEDRVYEFMFVAMPLNVPGGVGSPANAVAIK